MYSRISFSFYVRVFSIIIFDLPKLVKETFVGKMDPTISFRESGYDLKTCTIDKTAYLLKPPTQRPPIHQALSTNPPTGRHQRTLK